jgi:hypothetical protein
MKESQVAVICSSIYLAGALSSQNTFLFLLAVCWGAGAVWLRVLRH